MELVLTAASARLEKQANASARWAPTVGSPSSNTPNLARRIVWSQLSRACVPRDGA
jgi:hypothetical protein